MITMRAMDIVRRRRERARLADSRGRRLSRAIVAVALVALVGIVLGPLLGIAAGGAGLLTVLADLPDASALEQLPRQHRPSSTATYLYAWDEPSADGSRQAVIIDTITDPRASGAGWVRIAELPPHVGDAFLAALAPSDRSAAPSLLQELQAWWTNGVVPTPHSALSASLIDDHLRGAATGDTTRQSWQVWFLARQIDQRYTREQQLEWAINSAYFGHLAYGIEAAAQVYFGKSATELTLVEAAALSAAAQNPAGNPFDDPTSAEQARAAILETMTNAGAITVGEAEAALATPLILAAPPGSDALTPAFARLARRELESILGPEQLLAGGWQVETTLDLSLQRQVDCLLAPEGGSSGGPPCPVRGYLSEAASATDLAVVAIHPATGALLAIAGDADSPHPTGTLIQPLIYLSALSQGYSAATLTLDVPSIYLQDGRPYSPRNADGDYLGPLRLRQAMATSRLVPATQVLSWIGTTQVFATAHALGLAPATGTETADLTLPEAGFPASLLDLGRAFATVANGGRMAGVAVGMELPRPATIQRVVDAGGREFYANEPATREILSPALAYLVNDILSDPEARCPAGGCPEWPALPGGQRAAVTTGEAAVNAWAIGYTPDLLVGVLGQGESSAADLWSGLMVWANEDQPATFWPQPSGLRAVDVCAVSGLLPARRADCPIAREWFIPGTEPSEADTMVREVAVNRETNRLASIFTPPHLIERRTYIDYPPAAATWAEDAGIETPPTEYDTIRRVPTRAGRAAILSPEPWSAVGGQMSVVGSAGGEEFAYFRLAYFPGLLPEAMQTLVERGETPVEAAELGIWDTTLVEDGLYTLLLTVVHEDGTFDEVAVPVMVENE
jgi:membrane peptidoglycan carboxypeptidase